MKSAGSMQTNKTVDRRLCCWPSSLARVCHSAQCAWKGHAPFSTSVSEALKFSTGIAWQRCNSGPSSHLFHSSMVKFPSASASRSWKPMTSSFSPSQEYCDHYFRDRFLLLSASMLENVGTWSQLIPGFITHCSLHPAA